MRHVFPPQYAMPPPETVLKPAFIHAKSPGQPRPHRPQAYYMYLVAMHHSDPGITTSAKIMPIPRHGQALIVLLGL